METQYCNARNYREVREHAVPGNMTYEDAEKKVYSELSRGNNRVLELALFYGVPLSQSELLNCAAEYTKEDANVSDLKYAKRALTLVNANQQTGELERRIRHLQMTAPVHPQNRKITWKGLLGINVKVASA